MLRNHLIGALLVVGGLAIVACGDDASDSPVTGSDAGPDTSVATSDAGDGSTDDSVLRTQAVQSMHDILLADVNTLNTAAIALQAAAPTPSGRGWDPVADAAAITAMKAAWVQARTAYEHIEGALAPLFPQVDYSIDARYDDFLAALQATGGDTYLFDDVGVTGMHAIERILYTDNVPARVVTFEMSLPGYVPAAAPATEQEALDFKNKLAVKFVTDSKIFVDQWTPANINAEVAYSGFASLVQEQKEKVQKASTGEEESRYSQRTMADIRDNLEGTKRVYSAFQPWLTTKAGSADIEAKIATGFSDLDTAYALVSGDAVPTPPTTWSAENPSAADLATPFGQLYTAVLAQSDATKPDSVANQVNLAGTLLGFPASN